MLYFAVPFGLKLGMSTGFFGLNLNILLVMF